MKPVAWLGDSRERLREFPSDARRGLGYQLEMVQRGDEPRNWKPIPSVGPGVNEIRTQAGGAFRLMYVARFAEAIYVLHVFQKKSRKTARADLELAARHLRAVLFERQRR